MTATIPTIEPTSLAAGTSVSWYASYGDYPPSDGYTRKYYFRGAGVFDVEATDDSGQWLVEIAPTDTADVAAGTYRWFAVAEKGTEADGDLERWPVGEGVVEITPNPFTAERGDFQTHAERTLAMITAVIEGRITADVEAFTIGGRSVTQIPMDQLLRLKGIYSAAGWREQNPDAIAPEAKVVFRG